MNNQISNTLKQNILIFTNKLLPVSETFIANQTMDLKKFDAFFLGVKSSRHGIILPKERILLINNGGIFGAVREILFKLFGYIPISIFKKIKKINPVLIHAHFVLNGAIVLPLVERLHVPFILSALGSDVTLSDKATRRNSLTGKIYLKRRKRLSESVTKIIVPSQFLLHRAISRGFDKQKILVLSHGVNLSNFSTSHKVRDDDRILFVGRLVPVKGLNYLIQAIRILKQRGERITLSIIGDGVMRQVYEDLARLELISGYEFLGEQPQDVVRSYMEKSSLFCMPSISMPDGQTEAFGLVFAEALAAGLPAVSFDTGGVSEVVQNGVTGFLVKEANVEELADAIQKLLENHDLQNKMSAASRQRAEQYFNLQKQNNLLEKQYIMLLQEYKKK